MGRVRAAAPVGKRRIGDLLVEAGLITPEMLTRALDAQRIRGTKIVETLIHLGHITVDDFVAFMSRQPGMASLDLRRYQIQRDIVALIPQEWAIEHEIFPVDRMGRLLTVAMACPLDELTIGAIEEKTGLRVKPILCPARDIHDAIDTYYGGMHTWRGADETKGPKGGRSVPPSAVRKAARKSPAESEVRSPASAAAATPPDEETEDAATTAAKTRTGLRLTQAADQIHQITSLPILPATVARVQEALGDVSIAPREVAQTIATDPALAAKVLSVANSAAYGFASQVQTIELAVALLGLRETYAIVLSAAVLNLFDATRRMDYGQFWEESMNTAGAARILARCCARNKEGGAFTAGLLHDLGRIALVEIAPDLYGKVPRQLTGDVLVTAEHAVLGIAHPEAGYELAVHWGLPKALALAIRHHHHPEQAPECRQEAAVVALAEAWTRDARLTGAAKKDLINAAEPLLKLVGLDARAAETAYDLVSRLPRAEFAWDPSDAKSAKPAAL